MDELLKKYTAAFDTFKPIAIANLYLLPCAISDSDGIQTFTDKTSLINKFTKNCEAMKEFGYQRALFNILKQEPTQPR